MVYELKGVLNNLNQLEFLCEENILSNNFYKLNKEQFLFISCELKKTKSENQYIALKIDINFDVNTNCFKFKINPIILNENIDGIKKIIILSENNLCNLNKIDIRELYKDFFYYLSYEIFMFDFDKSIIPFLKYYINNDSSVILNYVEDNNEVLCLEVFDSFIIKTTCKINYNDNIYFSNSEIINNNYSNKSNTLLKLPDYYLKDIYAILDDKDKNNYISDFLNVLTDQECINIFNEILNLTPYI